MTDAVAGLPPRPPITFTTKALYGLGAAANIIKQRGITTFQLLFYNQVVGLPPATVSTAIMKRNGGRWSLAGNWLTSTLNG